MSFISLRSPARAGGSGARGDLLYYVRRLGLSTNCKLILDAGDSASYSSGQSWLDRSGNGYDFFLGTTSGAEGSDPTFNGTAGQRTASEYFSTDGGDRFRYDTTNETWMQNIHKNNAIFSIVAWVYTPNLAANSGIFGNVQNAAAEVGFTLFLDSSERLNFAISNGAGSSLSFISTAALNISAWNMISIGLNESIGANGGLASINATQETFTSTYTSPSASSATNTTEILATGLGIIPAASGTRIGMLTAWEGRMLTASEIQTLHYATRPRYGV